MGKKKELLNAKSMMIDLISGDKSIDENKEWLDMSTDILLSAKNLLFDNPNLTTSQKMFYLNNLWRVNYRGDAPPPTIEDFLTTKYLGSTADGIYSYIKEGLIEFFNPEEEYRHGILYLFTGAGKSYFSVLSTLFVLTHVMLLKNKNKFFGLNTATELSQGYFSFTEKKAEDLLIAPTQLIMESSPKFERC